MSITLKSFEGELKFTDRNFAVFYHIVKYYDQDVEAAEDEIADYCYDHDLYQYNVSAVYDAFARYIAGESEERSFFEDCAELCEKD